MQNFQRIVSSLVAHLLNQSQVRNISGNEDIAHVLGTAGGVVLAGCLTPQLYRTFKEKSADDISFGWVALYVVGLALNLAYFVMIGAIVAWATVLLQIAFCLALCGMKVFYSGKTANRVLKRTETNFMSDTCPRLGLFRCPSVFGSSFKSRPNPSVSKNRLSTLSDTQFGKKSLTTYRGHHFIFDYTFEAAANVTAKQFGGEVFAIMKAACDVNKLRYVHEKMVIFEEGEGETPPGFTSALLIDESHISAHCYSSIGLLALDVFTCGGDPENTKNAALYIHNAIKNLQAEGIVKSVNGYFQDMPRFPLDVPSEYK